MSERALPTNIPYPADAPDPFKVWRTAKEYHRLADVQAEKARSALSAVEQAGTNPLMSTPGVLMAALAEATAHAQLSQAYSALAWSPVHEPEFPAGEVGR